MLGQTARMTPMHTHPPRLALLRRVFAFLIAGALGATALLVSTSVLASESDSDDPRWCRACHTQEQFGKSGFGVSVHADMTCRDCHQGYHFNPHEAVEAAESEEATALAAAGVAQPVALAACGECHDNEEPGRFAHGIREDLDPANLPICMDCHGDPHVLMAAEGRPLTERRAAMNERCLACHTDPEKMEGIQTDITGWYEHSMHARKMHLGDERAPGCFDCHGTHETRDMEKAGDEACGQCHEGASPTFASLGGHRPITAEASPIGYYTQKFFAWLTFITIFLLSVHVLLDLLATIRAARTSNLARDEKAKHASEKSAPAVSKKQAVDPNEEVQRFDLHQRAQHLIMIVSFIVLVLTGWPLSAHQIPASEALLWFFGGLESAALIHRIAAIGLVFTSVYHLIYLTTLFFKQGRKVRLNMLPSPKDLSDAVGNVFYFLGLKKERPRFPRYSYFEKFDYWAVFWGVFIMVGSGFVRWFPVGTTDALPAWVYEIAFFAHADEALLAAMAIFVWHFYNVHLRPAVFPMSWVFLTGRMTMAELEHEHGAEYDEIVAKRAAESATEESSSDDLEDEREATASDTRASDTEDGSSGEVSEDKEKQEAALPDDSDDDALEAEDGDAGELDDEVSDDVVQTADSDDVGEQRSAS